MGIIDLRSDTVTQPTPAMRQAMAEAELGDDVYGEDPTVNRLEQVAAELMGKEAGLLVASGSMGNLVSSLSWCERGTEAIVGHNAHILINEMGALSALGGIQLRAVPTSPRGLPDPQAVGSALRPVSGFFPRTAMVELENTHNRSNGAALAANEMQTVAEVAQQRGIPVHLDGARIFNASVALGVPVHTLTSAADSVTFCLSKGLSCPIGSVVCGSKEFVLGARRIRKLLGGGMRQAGVIAAAGLVALETMISRLSEDHANAQRLAQGLAGMPGLALDPCEVETNIVYVTLTDTTASNLVWHLRNRGVLASGMDDWVRFVTHYGIAPNDVEAALEAIEASIRAIQTPVNQTR